MPQPTVVAKDVVVRIHYVLRDDAGNVIDTSGGRPLAYLHGHGNLVAGLEKALEGKAPGDEVKVSVPPEEGYGHHDANAFHSVHRRELPAGVKLEPGTPFRAEGSGGKAAVLWITKVQGARVTVTTNHPLAGRTLHFEAQIDSLREAQAEEIAHGHAHEGGHAH